MSAEQTAPYRVLARKYRPQSFADMIGQEALVRTLSNAIQAGRLPHAIVLTGVRGVGKTTTARIIARAINYVGPDGSAGPTVGPTDDCALCRAIAEDRHPDVIEMDAASRTGVDDIRELIEGTRYRPVEARYKVYIIDEVHMLSRNAFNALLKTLEEPPPHVVFIFATTEIRKVPVTVLSRCMRFDLRRVDQDVLAAHFARLCDKEGVSAEPEALRLVARAADGSVRDGLSLLDQAIALSEGPISAPTVQEMLGLADRERIYDLFEALMSGRLPEALAMLAALYEVGADPVVTLQDLLAITHATTRAKVLPPETDLGLPESERVRARAFAERLTLGSLTRVWQMLLKGISEAQVAPNPMQATEMVLVRLVYAADLPDPADLLKRLTQQQADAQAQVAPPAPNSGGRTRAALGGGAGAAFATQPKPVIAETPPAEGAPAIPSFAELAERLRESGELRLASHLRSDVHLIRFEVGRIELRPRPEAPPDLAGRLGKLLADWTGRRWLISLSEAEGEATLAQQEQARQTQEREGLAQEPLVRAILDAFPGARIAQVRALDEPDPESEPIVEPPVAAEPVEVDDIPYFDDLVGDEEEDDR